MTHRTSIARASVTVAVVAALAACGSPPPARLAITVSRGACGGPWHAPGGSRTFQITNGDIVTTEVELTDPGSGGVYAEVESLAPSTTRPMRVDLGRGAYAFRCFPEDNDAVTGPTIRVTAGADGGSPAVMPVSTVDLAGAVKTYSAYVTTGLGTLAAKAATLDAALRHGTRAAGRSAPGSTRTSPTTGSAPRTTRSATSPTRSTACPTGCPAACTIPASPASTASNTGCGTASRCATLAARADQLRADVAGLRTRLPDRADRPERPAAARTRDPGERAAVPADRPRRPGQRHQPRDRAREPRRHPARARRDRTGDVDPRTPAGRRAVRDGHRSRRAHGRAASRRHLDAGRRPPRCRPAADRRGGGRPAGSARADRRDRRRDGGPSDRPPATDSCAARSAPARRCRRWRDRRRLAGVRSAARGSAHGRDAGNGPTPRPCRSTAPRQAGVTTAEQPYATDARARPPGHRPGRAHRPAAHDSPNAPAS